MGLRMLTLSGYDQIKMNREHVKALKEIEEDNEQLLKELQEELFYNHPSH